MTSEEPSAVQAAPPSPGQQKQDHQSIAGEQSPFFSSLRQFAVSARLRHVLTAAEDDCRVTATLQDFKEDRRGFRSFIFRQPNIGRKTFKELEKVVDQALSLNMSNEHFILEGSSAGSEQVQSAADKALQLPFYESLRQTYLSVRLTHVLAAIEKPAESHQTIQDFLENRDGFRDFILKQPNMGRKSMAELETKIYEILADEAFRASTRVAVEDAPAIKPCQHRNISEKDRNSRGSRLATFGEAASTKPTDRLANDMG